MTILLADERGAIGGRTVQSSVSIHQEVGGQVVIRVAVEAFYRRVLADPRLAPFFEGVPMARLKGHQSAFLTMLFGGPVAYVGRSLREAHTGLGITDAAFDGVAQHLVGAFTEFGIGPATISRIVDQIAMLRGEIVGP